MATNEKRKVDTEARIFQEKWTIDYFFFQINEKPVCLLCSESVYVMKKYNVRRHYVTKHSAKYDSFQGERRKEKVQNMIKNLKKQQSIFTKKSDNADSLLCASYIVSEKIAKHSKNYSDVEFVKDCLIVVVKIIKLLFLPVVFRNALSIVLVLIRMTVNWSSNLICLLLTFSNEKSLITRLTLFIVLKLPFKV